MSDKQANPYQLPGNLPRPVDDGTAAHLLGMKIPGVWLRAADGRNINLADAVRGQAILYFYPATGVSGKDPAPGWDDIPGAPGCTVQSLSFRDTAEDFQEMGIKIFGVSTQSTEEQSEFSQRNKIPFTLLSDSNLELAKTLRLPMFNVGSTSFFKRLALFVREGEIKKVFYPIFPPDRNAADILSWFRQAP